MYLLGLSENLKTSLRSRTTVSVASGDTFYFRSKVNTLKPNFVREKEKERLGGFCHSPFLFQFSNQSNQFSASPLSIFSRFSFMVLT